MNEPLRSKPLEESYNGELDPMVSDTLDQLEQIHNNETVDRFDTDELGIDLATD